MYISHVSDLRVFPDTRKAAEACAAFILETLAAKSGPATLAISGGSSPKTMFEIFATSKFDWDRVISSGSTTAASPSPIRKAISR